MPTIKFVNEKKSVEVEQGVNLRKAARKNGVEVYEGVHKVLHCPGLGLCNSCMICIKSGHENVQKQGLWEKIGMYLNPLGFFKRIGREEDMRLSCQTTVTGDVEVETHPSMNWHGEKFWG